MVAILKAYISITFLREIRIFYRWLYGRPYMIDRNTSTNRTFLYLQLLIRVMNRDTGQLILFVNMFIEKSCNYQCLGIAVAGTRSNLLTISNFKYLILLMFCTMSCYDFIYR